MRSVFQALVAQQGRDDKIRQLWFTAAMMLDFAHDAKPLAETLNDNNRTVVSIVSKMMMQIYDCAVFLREYGGKGFLSGFSSVC
jgi:hypothetical protein